MVSFEAEMFDVVMPRSNEGQVGEIQVVGSFVETLSAA
jgi:hypothetical protein